MFSICAFKRLFLPTMRGQASVLSPSELSPQNEPNTAGNSQAGVIWVTGFSAAGKTTVCRQVERKLKSLGVTTVFLDGDDLRSIFGGHWGYERDERIKLAHIYFRLCSHLASQGVTVIIAAVAMYSDVRKWIEKNIPRAIEVYLRVPEEERRKRDRETKQVYDRIGNTDELYDVPYDPDLLFDNYGSASVEQISDSIVDYYRSNLMPEDADHGRTEHWQTFYNTTGGALTPSPYATTVESKLKPRSKILEVGCGNGRDASYFSSKGHSVIALDLSDAAIAVCRQTHAHLPIEFVAGRISVLQAVHAGLMDAVYSRFSLHAMTRLEQQEFLRGSYDILRPNGVLFIETRSIKDPLASMGEVISPTERVHGHYRRFVVIEELLEEVAQTGFKIAEWQESNGLAVFGDEDPVVIRLAARKE